MFDWKQSQECGLSYWKALKTAGEKDGSIDFFMKVFIENGGADYLNWRSGDAIIDVGSGPCGLFNCIKWSLASITCVAVDSQMDRYVSEALLQAVPGVRYIDAKLEDFDYIEANYGIPREYTYVFCINALDHTEDPGLCLRVSIGLLEDRGVLILQTDLRTKDKLNDFHPGVVTEELVMKWVEVSNLAVELKVVVEGRHGLPALFICARRI